MKDLGLSPITIGDLELVLMTGGGAPSTDYLLKEDADKLLLETGDGILKE
jgi:hypothetical protein